MNAKIINTKDFEKRAFNLFFDRVDKGDYLGALGIMYSRYLKDRKDKEVIKNLATLKSLDMLGDMGFFEAYDKKPIKSYMTHHQGMIMFALTRQIKKNAFKLFDSSAYSMASKILLSIEDDEKITPKKERPQKSRIILEDKIIKADYLYPPMYNFLCNGRYFSVQNSCQKGYSYFDGKYISRYSSYQDGIKIALSVDGEDMGEIFLEGRANFSKFSSEFFYDNEQVEVVCKHYVMPIFNGEMREFSIKNRTEKELL